MSGVDELKMNWMKSNRRNHYRILHVQPEAPFEVIRACYQALISILGKGGDPETVALINQAWAVLGDPAKRVAYDRSLKLVPQRPAPAQPVLSAAKAAPAKVPGATPVKAVTKAACPFCGTPWTVKIGRDTRCSSCASPLAPAPQPERKSKDLLDRREVLRIENELAMTVYATSQGGPLPARLKDLSVGGASMVVSNAVAEGQVIRMVARDFDALAMVVSARRKGQEWVVGSRLLTFLVLR